MLLSACFAVFRRLLMSDLFKWRDKWLLEPEVSLVSACGFKLK
jgi:hypothetical protein